MVSSFYRSFEDKYRGSRELIKSRLEVYLPFIRPLLQNGQDATDIALDLGCGRGEWLELLTEQSWKAKGVDQDAGMLEACREQNLKAEKGDALEYLKAMDDKSAAVITGFHIAEHLPFEKLKALVEQSFRVLKPGGLLILETPNPENLVVGTTNFYLDPTHERPLPPLLLSFLTEHIGFKRVKTLRLQEATDLLDSESLTLVDVFNGVSPDYAIIAQKNAPKQVLKSFDEVFSKDYGVSLNELANLYDEQKNTKQAALKIENEAIQQKAIQLASEVNAVKEGKATIEAVVAQLQSMSEQLQHNLDLASKEKAEFKDELKLEQQRTLQLMAELSAANEGKAASTAEIVQLQKTIQNLQQSLDSSSKEKAEFKDELKLEQQRTLQLMAELSAANEGKAASTAEIVQLQKTIQNLQQSLDSSSKEKAEFKDELKLEQQRAVQLMEELMTAKETQAISTAEVTQLQAMAKNLQHSLDMASKEKTNLNALLEAEQKQAFELLAELKTVQEQYSHLEKIADELAAAKDSNEHLLRELDDKAEQIKVANNELAELHAHSQWLKNEWEASKNKAEELNHLSHTLWVDTCHLNNELQAVYKSKSWRLTWPLRKVVKMIRWTFMLPIRLTKWLLRPVAVSIIKLVLRSPALMIRMRSLKKYFPSLYKKAKKAAHVRGLIVDPTHNPLIIDLEAHSNSSCTSNTNKNSDPNNPIKSLSSSAKEIYLILLDQQLNSKVEK